MIYLCKPTGVVLGLLNGIDEESCSLTQSVSDPWELSFTLQRYIDGEETAYYSSTTEMMELLLDTGDEKIRFQIDNEPTISGDGVIESKEVTAHSIEIELQTKFLHNFKINCGTKDSQEYLVGYYDDDDNFVNVNMNPYLNLPIDYIKVQNDFVTSLAKEKVKIQSMDLGLDPSTGEVKNEEAAKYLYNLLEEYPRLGCDIVDGEVKIYLHKIATADSPLGFYMLIPTEMTKAYLLSGIDSLISFYEIYGNQLSLIDLAIENAHASGWTVGDIPEAHRHKKFTFDIDSQDILSFFKEKLSSTIKLITDFDRYDRRVNLIDIAESDEPYDTGVYFTYHNLVNSVDITSSSDDGIRTKYIPTGANNLGILYANFGENFILDLNWLMNKVNEYGEYQYVSDSLRTKYYNWIAYRETTPVSYTIKGKTYSYDSRRDAYRELTKIYNQCVIDIDEFKYRLPNDACNIDYTTFSFKELNIAYKAYMNALEALIELYKADVKATGFEMATQAFTDENGNLIYDETDERHIRNTWYWYDFEAYYYNIIPNVRNALKMYVLTDSEGNLDPANPLQFDQEKNEWIEHPGGNPWYNGSAERVSESKADGYLYDVGLYGIVELENKVKAWLEAAAVLYFPGFLLKNGNVVDTEYVPGDAYKIINGVSYSILDTSKGYSYNYETVVGWEKLNDTQKEAFTDQNDYILKIGKYLDYVSVNERANGLTKGLDKGVIVIAEEKIIGLKPKLESMESEKDAIDAVRKQIADEVLMDEWSEFDERDLTVLHTLIREATYNNENILTTNLDNIVTTVNAQKELYEDATKALVEKARPQLSFEIGLDNLFAIEEFKPLIDSIKLLNFIRVSIDLYEDVFEKLRIVSIEKNPLIPTEDLTLTFSNMTYSLQKANDLAYMFGLGSGSSSGGGSGSGGGGGAYGTNDAEITIGNNMLNALLGQKTYAAVIGATSGTFGTYDLGLSLADNILRTLMGSEAFKEAIATSIINQLTKSGRTLLDLLTGAGLFQDFRVGNVVISGRCVTDYIKSSNYTGNTFSPSATAGSFLDLKQGNFNFGGGNITFDGSTLNICKGGIVFTKNNNGSTLNIADGGIVYNVVGNTATLTIQADTLKIGPRNVQDMIDDVEDKAEDAAKTATNYLYYDPDLGLVIGHNPNSPNLGYNVLISGTFIDLRNNETVYTRINNNGFYIFDGSGTNIEDDTLLSLYSSRAQIGNKYGPHIIIGEGAVEMYKDSINRIMSIYQRTDGKVNTDITGDYCINGVPVLTKNGFNSSLADAFMVKQVLVAEDWNISPNDWAGELFSVEDLLGTTLFNSYNVLGILGYEIDNYEDKGRFSRITVTGMSLYIGASGKQYVDITLRNNSPARGGCHINVYVSLFLVRKEITLVPSVIDNKDSHNTGDDDTEINT